MKTKCVIRIFLRVASLKFREIIKVCGEGGRGGLLKRRESITDIPRRTVNHLRTASSSRAPWIPVESVPCRRGLLPFTARATAFPGRGRFRGRGSRRRIPRSTNGGRWWQRRLLRWQSGKWRFRSECAISTAKRVRARAATERRSAPGIFRHGATDTAATTKSDAGPGERVFSVEWVLE